MTTPPTLEELAARADLVQCDTAYSVLARELLTLRKQIELIWETEPAASKRLDALESAPARSTSAPGMVNIYERFAEIRAERDDLAAQLARCEGERDDWKAEAARAWSEYGRNLDALAARTAERDALQRQLDAARGALELGRLYLRHSVACWPHGGVPAFGHDCSCGVGEAFQKVEDALASEPTTPTGGQS